MRDSNGRIVHGELPEGFSPRKLTVLPWKASDFPDLQTVTTVTETTYLETESSVKGSFYCKNNTELLKSLFLKKLSSALLTRNFCF
ncbi:hypothetical protein FHS45_002815 [Thalassobacillus devorans]|nr:hypothetical protein [Thalassobacillus devorans]